MAERNTPLSFLVRNSLSRAEIAEFRPDTGRLTQRIEPIAERRSPEVSATSALATASR